MKNKSLSRVIVSIFFALLFTVGAVGSLLTGFELPVSSHARLMILIAVFAILPPVLVSFRFGVWLLIPVTVQCGYWIWQDGALGKQLLTFAYTVSSNCHALYDWPIFGTPVSEEFDLVLILAAFLTAMVTGLGVYFRFNLFAVLSLGSVPLVVTFMAAYGVPDNRFLYLHLLGCVLLLIVDHTRHEQPHRTLSLLLRTVIPVGAALALLFLCFPREEYINRAEGIIHWFSEKDRTGGSSGSTGSGSAGESGLNEVKLRYVGSRNNSTTPVMNVTASYDGTVYLRGRDYDVYTGTAWQSSEERFELFTEGSAASAWLTIYTYDVHEVLYTPYYSSGTVWLTEGFVQNREKMTYYSYSVSRTPQKRSPNFRDYSDYTLLPQITLEWAVPLVESIVSSSAVSDTDRAEEIGAYVRNSAEYSLSASVMSGAYEDFVQWFLEKSDEGYCVHFASSAAVLLRAAGIPARYVEGYLTGCEAGEETVVTAREAHAWVEYYDSDGEVWRILEATPAMFSEGVEETAAETDVSEDGAETEVTSPETERRPLNGDTAETEQAETDSEDQNAGETEENSKDSVDPPPYNVSKRVQTALIVLLFLSVLPIQGEIRLALNKKRWNLGAPNERAIFRWSFCRRLAKGGNQPMPKELESLALKAKFSQHTLTEEELDRFTRYRKQMKEKAHGLSVFQRLILRWIYAVE